MWRLPVYHTILRILQNPTYAGAYAFGRTGTRTHVEEGQVHKSRGYHRAIDEWIVLLCDHHEPYISWKGYERHQQMLADNTNQRGPMAKGAVRRGQSLRAALFAIWKDLQPGEDEDWRTKRRRARTAVRNTFVRRFEHDAEVDLAIRDDHEGARCPSARRRSRRFVNEIWMRGGKLLWLVRQAL